MQLGPGSVDERTWRMSLLWEHRQLRKLAEFMDIHSTDEWFVEGVNVRSENPFSVGGDGMEGEDEMKRWRRDLVLFS